jgi:hypothetical protein
VVKFKPEERHLGKTKFTISRMMKLDVPLIC